MSRNLQRQSKKPLICLLQQRAQQSGHDLILLFITSRLNLCKDIVGVRINALVCQVISQFLMQIWTLHCFNKLTFLPEWACVSQLLTLTTSISQKPRETHRPTCFVNTPILLYGPRILSTILSVVHVCAYGATMCIFKIWRRLIWLL